MVTTDSSTPPTPVYKYASPETDYSPSYRNITTVMLVLATLTVLAQIYARNFAQKMNFWYDDALVYIAWTGLVGNCVGNYLIASGGLLGNTVPTKETLDRGMLGIRIDSGFYPYAMVAGKLSLLFLLRRIFNTRSQANKWFNIGWYFTFFLVFPLWFVLVYTWTGLSQHNIISTQFTNAYVIPIDSILTLVTDLCILALPVAMVNQLQLSWLKKISIMAIFALGSVGSVVSLVRVIFSFLAVSQNWDSRYALYVEGLLGLAEAAIVVICACLPALRPLFAKVKAFGTKAVTSLKTSRQGRSQGISLGSQGYNDDEPIRLTHINQQIDYSVAVEDVDDIEASKLAHAHLDGKSHATVTTRQHT